MPEASSALSRAPSPEEMVARARALAPRLAARAEQCERDRRVPEATIAEMKDAELDRLMVPARYGGFEMGWETLCEAAIELGKGCGSQAWVITIYGDHNHLIGNFAREAQDDVWGADPRALTSTCFQPLGTMRPKNGGYVVSGRWTFSSGIDHVQWILASAMREEGAGPPGRVFFLAPKREATVIDDWHVAGLAGTGSKSFTLEDVFVPDDRMIPGERANAGRLSDGSGNTAPVFRVPRMSTAGFGLAAVAVGGARGMLDAFVDAARSRVTRGTVIAEEQYVQIEIAESAAALRAAETVILTGASEMMARNLRNEAATPLLRTENKRDAAYAVRIARETVDRLFALSGGNSLRTDNAIQRHFRDVHAAASHYGLRWDNNAMPYGRVALGLDPLPGTY
jgi:alkylation response protein AidB-like acyl-CoA dehydrogenase